MADLPEYIKNRLIRVLKTEPRVKQAILFGSRARGDARNNSDIDLALCGSEIPLSVHTKLREAAGLYRLDIVRVDELENERLKENIFRDGVIVYQSGEMPASTL